MSNFLKLSDQSAACNKLHILLRIKVQKYNFRNKNVAKLQQ